MTDGGGGVVEHLALVRKIAARVKRTLGAKTVELEDLVQYGAAGLLEAQARFDPRYGVAFSTFAYHRIEGAMYDGLRRMGRLSRQAYAHVRAAEYLANAVDRAAGSTARPTTEEALREVLRVMRGVAAVAVAAEATEADDAVPADEQAARRQLAERVRRAVAALPERERHFIEKHYYEDKTLTDAGVELGVTKSWASRLHARAVDMLREKLKDTG
ncbi:MAG TPA: sigma-70 family RNA polymerase sigma factor [Haliangiales bacterium]|nr:sigma-70 family RNA polymerase sigma factor [Haliangiales bacterium]